MPPPPSTNSRARPYLRAYLAGLAAPSVVVCLAALIVACFFSKISPEVERAMIFPMAINPAAWGLWNMLHRRLASYRQLPIGLFGTVLPLVLVPAGVALAQALSLSFVTVRGAMLVTPPTVAVYYLIWTYVVRYLNELLGVAEQPVGRRGGI